ncbi:unnamed protein product, partial [Cladocopium goreaui]
WFTWAEMAPLVMHLEVSNIEISGTWGGVFEVDASATELKFIGGEERAVANAMNQSSGMLVFCPSQTVMLLPHSTSMRIHTTIKLPPDFDVLSLGQCRAATDQYCQKEKIKCKIRAGRSGASEGTTMYAYCQKHKDCGFSWKHVFSSEVHAIFIKGAHAEVDRQVRGVPVERRMKAAQAVRTCKPMEAVVDLIAHDVPAAEWPSKKELTALDGRNGWTILSQPDGVCMLAHESFAEDAAQLIAQSSDTCPIVAVQDVTYKVFGSDWGLYRFAIASKHFDAEGIARTSLHTLSLGVVAKESEEHLSAVLGFTRQWHATRGNQLAKVIHQIHGDQGPGGIAAVRSIFPKAVFRLDQRHQLTSMMRHACGAVASRKLACALLQFAFSGLYWCDGLWQLYIDALLQRLIEQGEVDYAAYLQQHVFTLEDKENQKMWTSLCRNRISLWNDTVTFQTSDATMQYCKTEQIMCRIRAGGAGFFPAGEGTIFYCYCVQHKDCKFSWKHLFAGGDHAIFTKGVHCEIDRWLAHLQALDGRNGWSIGSQPNGACALLHESFARDAATLIAQSSDTCPIVAVQDVTYKVFGRDWGLYRCAIASKHFDEEGIPKPSLHTFSLGVVETENEERAVLQFTGKWHAARGNHLAQVIHQIHGHLGPRFRAAARWNRRRRSVSMFLKHALEAGMQKASEGYPQPSVIPFLELEATMQYCKTEQIMCRIRAGGAGFFPAGEGTIFYCYCVQHKDCKFSWKHLFAGGDHAIFTKGVHCEIDRWLAHLQALDGRNGWSIGSQPSGACALLHESFARDAATLIAQSSDICPIVAAGHGLCKCGNLKVTAQQVKESAIRHKAV